MSAAIEMTAEISVPSSRRRMLALWVRTGLSIAIVLSLPVFFPMFLRSVDPQRERVEMAQALEHQQRSGGEPVVLRSGEVGRAVVFTSASPSAREDASTQRGLMWWSRLLAAVMLIGAFRRTLQLVRIPAGQDHATMQLRDT